jgi:predicted enzyme related to lactoylglutathione lyase
MTFCRYLLRTTDADAARRFYAGAIGLALPDGRSDASSLEAWPLHEQARARGAPPHWLGQIAVDDVEHAAERLVAHGGVRFATVRDPSGAVVGVRSRSAAVNDRPVEWHQLHTRELDRAWALYAELFGWAHVDTIDLPDPAGGHRLFAWAEGGEPVGSIANTARWPGVCTRTGSSTSPSPTSALPRSACASSAAPRCSRWS